jgi:predicted kinase
MGLRDKIRQIIKESLVTKLTEIERVHGPDVTFNRSEELDEDVLTEGINDPGILKAVFLAGGPGSGKSFSAEQVFGIDNIMKGTSTTGLKVVNSDPAFENELKKKGVDPKNLAKMTDKVFKFYTSDKAGSVRDKAKKIKTKLERIYHEGRLGLIIDGTGHDYGKIAKKKERLEQLGYDTSMLFINTSLPVALKRNSQRERVLPEKIVKKSWHAVQDNLGKFQTLFGNNFNILDNSEIGNFSKMHNDKIKAVNKIVKAPIKNPIGKQWIENEKKLRGIK